MKEIEVKAYLKDKEKVIKKLTELGCVFEESVFQDGIEFSPIQNPNLEQYLKPNFFLRIRTTNNIHVLTLKKPISGEHALSKIEHETEIVNRVELEKLFEIMGYYPVLQIQKERIICHYKEYEICLDEVEKLGSFIEIEKMSKDDPKIVRDELQNFLFLLGVQREDEVHEGYDILLFKKLRRV